MAKKSTPKSTAAQPKRARSAAKKKLAAAKKSVSKKNTNKASSPAEPSKSKPAKKKTATKKTSTVKASTAKSAPAKAKRKPAQRSAAKRKEPTVSNPKPPVKSPKGPKKPASKPTKTTPKRAKLAVGKVPLTDKTAEGYLSTLNDWRKDAVASLRTMIRKAAPKAAENVKGSQPVYEHHGPFAWIKAHAKHVNLGFWRGVELPDPRKLLQGTGEKMRHIKLSSLKDAGKKELQELVRIAAKLNEIKGNPARGAKGKAKHK